MKFTILVSVLLLQKYVLVSQSWETPPRKGFSNDIPTYSFSVRTIKFRSERRNSIPFLLNSLERGKNYLKDFNFAALLLIICNLFSFSSTRSKSKRCLQSEVQKSCWILAVQGWVVLCVRLCDRITEEECCRQEIKVVEGKCCKGPS